MTTPTRMADIAAEVASRYGITVEQIRSTARDRRFAWPRQEAFALCRVAGHSTTKIGRFFGRDHATVMYGAAAHIVRSAAAQAGSAPHG